MTRVYQVLKKWLSCREHSVLGGAPKPEEVPHLTDTARRITPSAVRRHAAADLGAVGAGRLTRGTCGAARLVKNGHTSGAVSAECPERRAFSGSHRRPR